MTHRTARCLIATLAAAAAISACGGSSKTSSSARGTGTTSAATTASGAGAAPSSTTATATGSGTSTAAATTRTIAVAKLQLPTSSGCRGATSAGGNAKRIPIRVTRIDSEVAIVVNVCIDAKGPFPFQLDTGSASSTIDSALAARLNLPTVGKPESFNGAGCTGKGQERQIASWSLDGIPLHGQTATGAKLPHFGGPGEPDGLLGSDVLGDFGAVRIDFRHQDIVVPGPEGPSPRKEILVNHPARTPLPAALVHGTPKLDAPMKVDSAKDQTIVFVPISFGSGPPNDFTPDTGASTSLVDSGVAKHAGLKPLDVAERQNTACSTITVPEVSSGRWSIAHHTLTPQPLVTHSIITSGPAAGLLGADQMARFGSVVFDYHGGRLILGAG